MTNPDYTIHEVKRQNWMDDLQYAWAQKEEISRVNTLRRRNEGGGKYLIAIKAQDPLNPDGTPGPEFIARLSAALKFVNELVDNGIDYAIMTFGGIHDGCASTPLAESGANWLQQHGIPPESIIVNSNIYAGNDEDDLALQEFSRDPAYSELHTFLSVGQVSRSLFFSVYCGWQPTFHPITFTSGSPRHSFICEFSGRYGSSAHSLVNNGFDKIEETTKAARQRHADDLAAFMAQQSDTAET